MCISEAAEMGLIMRDPVFHNDAGLVSAPEDVAYALLDAHGMLLGWNAGAERLLGYTAEEVRGRHGADLLHTRSDATDLAARCGVDEVTDLGRVPLRHRDGRRVDAVLWAHPFRSTEGTWQWLLQAADADTSRRREVSDALLRGLLTESPFLLDVFDTELRFVAQTEAKVRADWYSGKDFTGHTVTEVAPPGLLDWAAVEARQRQVLDSGEALIQTEVRGHTLDAPGHEHVWSESILPLRNQSGQVIAVAQVVADVTERAVARERLALVNDASTQIGSTLDVLRTAQELVDVAVPRFADHAYVNLLEPVFGGQDPTAGPVPPAGVRLRRAAHSAGERSEMGVAVGDLDAFASRPDSLIARCLASGKSLIMPGREVAAVLAEARPDRATVLSKFNVHSWMVTPMFARGAALGTVVFGRSEHAEPFDADDRLLAEEFVARASVCIDNASRYSRERTTALGLQRSLLPQQLPSLTAVTTASRYVPASGTTVLGGAWFDVIPLSGTRVALVVGDVLGTGLHATVTMGRLRTAVRTLADLDLAPDELLTHLDDQVKRLQAEQGAGARPEVVGVTCAYAVYDPIAHSCVLAQAGHTPPILLRVDGSVRSLELPSSPRLGLGGAPFETTEVNLAEGELLVMYTAGLLGEPEQATDTGPEPLLEVLSNMQTGTAPTPTASSSAEVWPELERICDTLIQRLPPVSQHNSAALLVARMQGLPSDRHVTWEVPPTPEAVGEARAITERQLADWGMQEEAFTTELLVSELVTNAIRYGTSPIQLRLIHDQSLICEVSDGSSTSPHIRRALETDEGGRGLFLVAQLSRLWGTRYGTRGKTIWAEQPLTV
ncbi:SpoIIE family protein phosphatase [Streptomyces sp. NPDC001177]